MLVRELDSGCISLISKSIKIGKLRGHGFSFREFGAKQFVEIREGCKSASLLIFCFEDIEPILWVFFASEEVPKGGACSEHNNGRGFLLVSLVFDKFRSIGGSCDDFEDVIIDAKVLEIGCYTHRPSRPVGAIELGNGRHGE